jgi:hypothetical protein
VESLDAQIEEATRRIARVPERLVEGLLAEIEKIEAESTAARTRLARLYSRQKMGLRWKESSTGSIGSWK